MEDQPRIMPFEALEWKFRLGDMVVHRSSLLIAGVIIARIARQTRGTAAGFDRCYQVVRSSIAPIVDFKESELAMAHPNLWSIQEDPPEAIDGDQANLPKPSESSTQYLS